MSEWKRETVNSIVATNGEAVVFRFPVEVWSMHDMFAFHILVLPVGLPVGNTSHEIAVAGSAGRSLQTSLDGLVERIRRRVTRYLTTFSDLLTDIEIDQKAALMAYVDVAESGLMVGVKPTDFVFGYVARTDKGLVFRTNDDPPRDLEIPESVGTIDEHEISKGRLAEVVNDKGGYPVGPVVKLEPAWENDTDTMIGDNQ